MTKSKYGRSPSQLAWARFRRKKSSVLAAIFILILLVVGVFAPVFSPDPTEKANRMSLEAASLAPLSEVLFLKIPTTESHETIIEYLFTGKEQNYRWQAIESYQLSNDTLKITLFNSGGLVETLPVTKHFESGFKPDKNLQKFTYWLGSDTYGRDMLSRLIWGARISMAVGLIAVAISVILGLLVGSLAGFYGGRVDDFLSWIINVTWSIPTLLLVISISMALGKGIWQVFIAVGFTMWVEVARVVRGQIFQIREIEYVKAGIAMGFRNSRIILRHIIPAVTGPLIVIAAANFSTAILLEAGLSFLGIGVQPPTPSWGFMINSHMNYLILDSAYLALVPGVMIFLLVLAFYIVGSGLRDALSVQ